MNKMMAAEQMVQIINAERSTAKARVWVAKDEEGDISKIRVYLDKGYVELRDGDKAYMETVGRTYFESAKSALVATGYQRVYA